MIRGVVQPPGVLVYFSELPVRERVLPTPLISPKAYNNLTSTETVIIVSSIHGLTNYNREGPGYGDAGPG